MQQQLARAQPARVKIGKIPPRKAFHSGFAYLVSDENMVGEKPSAASRDESEQQCEFRSLRQTVHSDCKGVLLGFFKES